MAESWQYPGRELYDNRLELADRKLCLTSERNEELCVISIKYVVTDVGGSEDRPERVYREKSSGQKSAQKLYAGGLGGLDIGARGDN